jgi:hypothetical protein
MISNKLNWFVAVFSPHLFVRQNFGCGAKELPHIANTQHEINNFALVRALMRLC